MRKAAKIVLLVGGIFGILSLLGTLACLALVPVLALGGLAAGLAPVAETLIDLLSDMDALMEWLPENAAAIAIPAVSGFVAAGVLATTLLVDAVLALATAITCFVGSKAKPAKKGIHIVNIVFGILGTSLLALVGGVLGLIAAIKEKKALPAEEPAEEEPVAEAE